RNRSRANQTRKDSGRVRWGGPPSPLQALGLREHLAVDEHNCVLVVRPIEPGFKALPQVWTDHCPVRFPQDPQHLAWRHAAAEIAPLAREAVEDPGGLGMEG